ncbi:hypothetical protein [Pseudarthrobacter sp. C1]|uniref:hypothetical protein n=1 Tax=Pseudarthrobacter sp. C1 TaxID=3108940 RepID=UPI002B05CE6A|nr:hypothetical protein [Pseudarthrobacter sp. C1]MEA3549239.1 hypothetical protein [Pseudarthrobacter sp. C1]
MTDTQEYDFYFEAAGRAGYQGPNDPSGEYFTNKDLEQSLTREIIQNSMDAKSAHSSCVTVEFDLRAVATDEIPGIKTLRDSIAAALAASQDLQGRKYLAEALHSVESDVVPVLRIGDYGTKGLTGSESKDTPLTPLSTLTRSTGASSSEGSRGGSFGIGSAVGPLASKMRTVAYTSKPFDEDHIVFAAISKLASHRDNNNEWRQGTGYYTSLLENDFKYLRNPAPFGHFPARSVDGTDLFIFDYREAGRDSGLADVKRAAVENFMVAIHRGALVVKGRTEGHEWILNSETLSGAIDADDHLVRSARPFYRALTESEPVVATLKTVGEVELYLFVDDTLEKKLGTQVMRKPLMKVDVLNHTIHVPYAAIFICANDAGNSRLREIEPPTHDRWNDRGPRSDGAAVREIRKFIREELMRMIPQKLGKSASIKGLAKFLPIDLGAEEGKGIGGTRSSDRVPSEKESPRRLGRPEKLDHLDWRDQGAVSVPVSQYGAADGDSETEGRRGNKAGSASSGDGDRKDTDSGGVLGDGRSRILPRTIKFRSFAEHTDGQSTVVVTALEDVNGDLELSAYGAGNADVYDVPIEKVMMRTASGMHELDVQGSTIRGLKLDRNQKINLQVTFGHGGRYRLGVKNG